ncbi:MAG: DUF4105 domain-containing protein [Spirochaetia bacterium]|nr:DUF4105 domain-containing protein [Spirochaetia bacterium]
MIFPMKRLVITLLLLTIATTALFSFSMGERRVQQQPFDSELELGKIDFAKPLAPNQLEWVNRATLSLLTVGSGDPLYAWFGHSALIIGQPSGGEVMYDYGVFDPDQKNFYLNFARGRMYYSVWESGADWRIEEALSEKRDVKLIELKLSPEAKLAAIRFLQNNAKEENSTYLYHFYYDNCATRIRDILNAATGGEFRLWAEAQNTSSSYRQLVQRYMSHSPIVFWALDFLQGKTIDKPLDRYEEMFLPESLYQAVLDFSPSIVMETQVLQDTTNSNVRFRAHTKNVNYDWAYALSGIALALILSVLGYRYRRTTSVLYALVLFVLGVLGSILLFMMTFSDMDMTWFNENIILMNPLLFIGMGSAIAAALPTKKHTQAPLARRTYQVMFVLGIALVVAKGLWPTLLVQDNLKVILLLLPLSLSGAAFYGRGDRKEL